MQAKPFGVIEGFYGDPWTWDEREQCIDTISGWGANTYVWAPKSDPRHRDQWNEPFTSQEIAGFSRLITRDERVVVSVGLTPGDGATAEHIAAKLAPVISSGCRIVTLSFDDLPALEAAARHRDLANSVRDLTGADVWIVPTHYAGTVSSSYLTALFNGLDPAILVMWTGVHVVNDVITSEEIISRRNACVGRHPLVWDNVPVNDAMMSSHLHIGPFTGRDPGIIEYSAGLLLNPMISMRASLPTIRSACAWWKGQDAHAAWQTEVDVQELRLLAEATSYPGDPHWPGDEPNREWLERLAALTDTGDDELDPWIDSARRGARICLDAMSAEADARDTSTAAPGLRSVVGMIALREWLRTPARTLGAGPRTRPFFTQDESGRFVATGNVMSFSRSIPEVLVQRAFGVIASTQGDTSR